MTQRLKRLTVDTTVKTTGWNAHRLTGAFWVASGVRPWCFF